MAANIIVDGNQAFKDIDEVGHLRGSTVLSLLSDATFAVALAVPAISVPMAIAGIAYTYLGWRESEKEKKERKLFEVCILPRF